MNGTAYTSLWHALRAACRACGIRPDRVKALAPGVVEIDGSGVAVFWTSGEDGSGPEWLVRETYDAIEGGRARPQTQTVASAPEAEYVRAAKAAVLLVLERRMDAELSTVFARAR